MKDTSFNIGPTGPLVFTYEGRYYTTIDNIKYFRNSIINDPNWEYNGGNGIENALLNTYPSSNNYNPILNGLNSGVGYHYIQMGSSTPKLDQQLATANQMIINDIPTSTAPGIYIVPQGLGKYVSGSGITMTTKQFVEGIDYVIGDPMNTDPHNIMDVLQVGDLATNKYIRILHNNINILNTKETSGLYLTPIAKELNTNLGTPGVTQCWIDLINNKIIMPRPSFWSKCVSYENLMNPDIAITLPYMNANNVTVETTSAKFGKGIKLSNYIYGTHGVVTYKPFGNTNVYQDSGVFSIWLKNECHNSFQNSVYTKIWLSSSIYVIFYNFARTIESYVALYVNNNLIGKYNTNEILSLAHLYIVWDKDKNLQDGESIVVYVNNSKRLSTNADIITYRPYIEYSLHNNPDGSSEIIFDNIKIWDHIVSPFSTWDWNEGNGREDNLHTIYGINNNYKPSLKVSYYSYTLSGNKMVAQL